MGESLAPHLPQITTLMLLSLRSTEGIVVSGRLRGSGPVGEGHPWDGSSLQGPAELKSLLGLPIQPQYDGSHTFLLFDDESSGEEEEELMEEDDEEEDDSEISG